MAAATGAAAEAAGPAGAERGSAPSDSYEPANRIDILGPGKNDARSLTSDHASGVEAALRVSEGQVFYELKVPLAKTADHPYAIETAAGKTIGIGFETPKVEQPASEGRSGGSGGGYGHGGGGGMGGGRGGGGMHGGGGGALRRPSGRQRRRIPAAETAQGVGDRDPYWFAGSIARTEGSAARRSSRQQGHPSDNRVVRTRRRDDDPSEGLDLLFERRLHRGADVHEGASVPIDPHAGPAIRDRCLPGIAASAADLRQHPGIDLLLRLRPRVLLGGRLPLRAHGGYRNRGSHQDACDDQSERSRGFHSHSPVLRVSF